MSNLRPVVMPNRIAGVFMNYSAEGSSPRTIREIVAVNPGAALVYPDGPPQAVAAPDWSPDGETEMNLCQREFFLKNYQQVPDISLQEVVYSYDCIGFMNAAEAEPWLPIWMCASFYAVDFLHDPTENVTSWTQYALEKCMKAGHVPVCMAAIDYFAKHVCDSPELEPELYATIDTYRQARG